MHTHVPSAEPTATLEWLTADDARTMLAANTKNRAMRTPTVQRYAADMAAGDWQYTADPIRFAENGRLLDGQHRLAALAQQAPEFVLPCLVVRGLAESSQMVMDQGRKRSTAQQLQLMGVRSYAQVAAGVKLHLWRASGALFRDADGEALTSTAAIQSWVTENRHTVDALDTVSGLYYPWAAPSVNYAAAIAFWSIDPAACARYFELLTEGAGAGHPINTLDKRLQRERTSRKRTRQRDQLGMLFHAWNLWRDGATLARWQMPRGGTYTAATFPHPAEEGGRYAQQQ